MNEIFADAYQMTGEAKYLATAKRFSHKVLLNPMAKYGDYYERALLLLE